jgi:hypothetical protein
MSWVEPPASFDVWPLVEFIEAELLLSEDDYLSITEIRGLFSSGQQPSETQLLFAFAEMQRRSLEWGAHYPFLADRGAWIDRENSAVYGFLLSLSLKGMPVRADAEALSKSDPIFDALVREAFAAHVGGKSLIFGWPTKADRPESFPDAVEWLSEQLGLGLRAAKTDLPETPKDAGVDVVAWKPFPDGKTGFASYLVQNTVQWNFRKKPKDVDALRWFSWINWSALPGVGFAVPFAIPEGDIWWDEVASGTSIVMDRGRLLHALADTDPVGWSEWQALTVFVESELALARRLESGAPRVGPQRRRKKPATK